MVRPKGSGGKYVKNPDNPYWAAHPPKNTNWKTPPRVYPLITVMPRDRGGFELGDELDPPPPLVVEEPEIGPRPKKPITSRAADFAVIVRDRAVGAADADRLLVTTKDGLAAQALIDRREEREKDRAFVLNLARLISGAGQPPPAAMISEGAIEGDFSEVDSALLAPAELRAE